MTVMLSSYLKLIKRYPRYLAYSWLHTFFSSFGQTFFFALFVPQLNLTFNLSTAESGTLYGIITLLSAVTLLYSGALLDKTNVHLYSTLVGFGLGLGAFLMGTATHLWQALIAMFVLRHFGQALMTFTASTATARYFTHNRGKALGLKGLGISLGEAILPITMVTLYKVLDWQQACLTIAFACWFIFIPLSRLLVPKNDPYADKNQTEKYHDHPDAPPLDTAKSWTRSQALQHSYFWMVLPLMLSPAFIATALFYHQDSIITAKSWSMQQMASMFLGYGICRFAFSFFIGPLIDHYSAIKILPWTSLPLLACLFSLLLGDSMISGFVYLALLGITQGATEATFSAAHTEAFGRIHLASIKSLMGMAMVFSTALSPPLWGWLLGQGVSVMTLVAASISLVGLAALTAALARVPNRS